MTVRFLIGEGLAALRRVAAASFISAFLIGVALAIVGGLMVVAFAYRGELLAARRSANVEVFLAEKVSDLRARQIASEITAFPVVESARVRSREEAAKLFDLSVDPSMPVPLPLTVQVTLREEARTLDSVEAVRGRIAGINGVDDVAFPSDLLTTVEERSALFFRITLAIGIALSLGAIGITATTAQLTVVSRRSVIRTMWLMGAEERWVLAPFIMQGLVIGLGGGSLSAAILYSSWLLFPGLEHMFPGRFALLPLLFPLVGALLGVVGSGLASRYYIRREERR